MFDLEQNKFAQISGRGFIKKEFRDSYD